MENTVKLHYEELPLNTKLKSLDNWLQHWPYKKCRKTLFNISNEFLEAYQKFQAGLQ